MTGTDARAPTSGAASSRSTATGCRSPTRRRSSRCARAARRSSRRRLLSERHRLRRLPQGRGRQPHRVVQGPRHDDGDLQGRRGGRPGGHLRVDRQHLGVAPRPTRCGPGWSAPCWCPQGKIALGKMAQALVHGAQLLQVDGNFDDCLDLARELSENYPVALVNSVNPARIEGQKTAAFEIVDVLGDAPDVHCLPVGNAGNITAYWKGYREYAADGTADRAARGCGASRRPAPRRSSTARRSRTRRRSPPRSGSATRRRGTQARRGARRVRRPDRRGDRPADPARPTGCWPRRRASSSSRRRPPRSPGCCRCTTAGLLDPGQTRRVHGHRATGSRTPSGPSPARRSRVTVAGRRRRRRRRAGSGLRRSRWQPARCSGPRRCASASRATSANLGPGLRRVRPRAGAVRRRRRSGQRRRRGSGSTSHGEGADAVPRDDEAPRRAKAMLRRVRRARRSPARPGPGVRQPHPARARPRIVAPRRSSSGVCAGRARSSSAATSACPTTTVLELADRLEGHPDNVAAALYGGHDGRLGRPERSATAPSGPRVGAIRSMPRRAWRPSSASHEPGRRPQGPPAAARAGAARRRRRQRRQGGAARRGADQAAPDAAARGDRGPAAPAVPAPAHAALRGPRRQAARAGIAAAIISGRGPDGPGPRRRGHSRRALERLAGARFVSTCSPWTTPARPCSPLDA